MSSEAQEALKEILFGGAFGLCSGIVLKKLSLPFLAGASSALFFLFRAAIFGKNFFKSIVDLKPVLNIKGRSPSRHKKEVWQFAGTLMKYFHLGSVSVLLSLWQFF